MRDFHEELFDRADWARRITTHRIDRATSFAEHRAIMDAVLSRDAALAVSLLNQVIDLLAPGNCESGG